MSLKLPDFLSEEELVKVLDVTPKAYHKLAFALGFYQCMRVSEVIKLQKEDVDMVQKLLKIRQAKGSKDRIIPIAPEVMKGLKHLPIPCGVRALEIQFKKKALEALNRDLHFHTLRHGGCTHYLIKKKWSTLEVQRMAGHSNPNTTQIYTHINPQDLVNRMWE
jgi:integrase/recombinase XerD